MAGLDGTLAVIGQTKLKVFSSDLNTITYTDTYTSDSILDVLYYPLEGSVYLLRTPNIITKCVLATNTKTDLIIDAYLRGYNLED